MFAFKQCAVFYENEGHQRAVLEYGAGEFSIRLPPGYLERADKAALDVVSLQFREDARRGQFREGGLDPGLGENAPAEFDQHSSGIAALGKAVWRAFRVIECYGLAPCRERREKNQDDGKQGWHYLWDQVLRNTVRW